MMEALEGFQADFRSPWVLATSTVLAVLAVLAADYAAMLKQRRELPPGPRPWPIVGNSYSLPPEKPWVWFEKLSKDLDSGIITIWIGRRPQIWICDCWIADELLNKRASNYSSRPRMVVFSELGTGAHNVLMLPYGQRWRELRKVTAAGVGMGQIKSYQKTQSDEAKQVVFDLLTTPELFAEHLERYAASVMSTVGFGRRLVDSRDPIIEDVLGAMKQAGSLNVPGTGFPVILETFPFFASLPTWLPFMRRATAARKSLPFFLSLAKTAAYDNPNDNAMKDVFMDHRQASKLTDWEVASLAGNFFGGGAETSSYTLISFVLACVAFPETLAKAWEELDRAVGHDRSPDFEDHDNLPYVNAFVSEVLRWRSVAVMGGQPHAPLNDDVFEQWRIPAGTWVQANLWAIHRHPREFPEPDRFNPDRFLKENRRPYPDRKGLSAFGYGRRVCAGQALAEQGTLNAVARLLWAYKILPGQNAGGGNIPVDIFAYTNGLNIKPRPFPARFVPRSERIRATIIREGKQALEDMEPYNLPLKTC